MAQRMIPHWRGQPAAIALGCFGLLTVAASVGSGHAADSGFSIRLEDPASGEQVSLEPGARALHLVFFATWCPPCVNELDHLAELEARWRERGYRLVLIAVRNRHSRARLVGFQSQRRPPGELLFDVEGRAEKALGGTQLPTHLLFDGSGREVLRASALDESVEEGIEQLLLNRRRSPGRRP